MKIVKGNTFLSNMYYKLTKQVNLFELKKKAKSIVVTSSDLEVSTIEFIKSFVKELKDSNKTVLLIDTNFRSANLRYTFKVTNEFGVSDIVKGNKDIESCIIRKDGMDILMSGDISVNPEEVIGTECMKNIIEDAKQRYDYILVNTSSIGVYSDAWVLSSFSDKTVLIKGNDKGAIKESLERLNMVGANIVEGYYLDTKENFSFTSPIVREALMA